MNKKLALSTIILSASLLSITAQARGGDRYGWSDQRHHGHDGWRPVPHVVHVPARPVYVRPPVSYYQPAYYPQPVYAPAPVRYAPGYVYYNGDRLAGQVVGAVAGGVIGNVISGGALAPTAIGAVLGGIIGGDLAD